MKTAFWGKEETIKSVFASGRFERVAELSELYPEVISEKNLEEHIDKLTDIEAIFSTWGMLKLTEAQIELMPSLKAVFYAGGSTKYFARPFLNKGIKVISAWKANAVPVAEFATAQIILACKQYFQNIVECKQPDAFKHYGGSRGRGSFGEKIAIIGFGAIAQKMVELLKPVNLQVLIVDNHITLKDARKQGFAKVTIEEAFSQAYVVSNHLPNLETNKKIINKKHFELMRPNATFINTGRGDQVDEDGMVQILRKRTDIVALLDVTFPEPPVEGSPLYKLPNIFLSAHIAGSMNDELVRMADYVIEEYRSFIKGENLEYEISLEMLDKMA
jgi:phosphoglycerate dehydrogenase-like enzyme